MINHIISECSKLAQKEYKTRHNWMTKVIYREMCKKSQFDYTNKWYMPNPASVLENDTNKLLGDFDIICISKSLNIGQKTTQLQQQQQQQQKMRSSKLVDFTVPADIRIKLKESEKKDKYLDLAKELKKKTNYGTWRWQLCQSWWVLLVPKGLEILPKVWKEDWMSWKSEDESRLSRLQHC